MKDSIFENEGTFKVRKALEWEILVDVLRFDLESFALSGNLLNRVFGCVFSIIQLSLLVSIDVLRLTSLLKNWAVCCLTISVCLV